MILIAYDGSAGARTAIAQAAHLMPGHPATVLCVWEARLADLVEDEPASPASRHETTSAATSRVACRLAEQGAALAHEAGIDAGSEAVVSHMGVADTILSEAARLHADAIVIGSHGHPRLGTALLGSLGRTLMQLSNRPVLVIPAARDGQPPSPEHRPSPERGATSGRPRRSPDRPG